MYIYYININILLNINIKINKKNEKIGQQVIILYNNKFILGKPHYKHRNILYHHHIFHHIHQLMVL